jgi:hypothetical protein
MRRLLRRAFLILLAVAALTAAPIAAADEGDVPPPVAHIDSSLDGRAFPQGYNMSFGFWCTSGDSDMSWIVACDGSQPLGSSLDTTHAGPHTVTVTATDYFGRTATTSATYTVIDTTPPHIIFRTPTDGMTYAQGASLFYDYSCEDDPGGLGILACESSPFAPSGIMPLDTNHLGTFTFTVFAFDQQLNAKQQTVTYTIADRTPPTITIDAPADGSRYEVGDSVFAAFSCDDGQFGSGTSFCKGDLPQGNALDTSNLGAHAVTVNTSDRAGNAASLTHTYSVVYDFSGFFSPTLEFPTAVAVKAGEGVPIKFSLAGSQGLDIFAAGSPRWAVCGSSDTTSAPGALSYNPSNDRYTYLAATQKSWAGSCRDFQLTLRDGTTHQARFTFSK